MKSSRLRRIITDNENLLGEEEFIEMLIKEKKIKREEIEKASKIFDLKKQLHVLQGRNVKMLTILDKDYPENLKDLEDAPPILYCRGKLVLGDGNAVAIVGTRRATHYGKAIARALGEKLSALGITVVSGMARGIDTHSHIGALRGGGRTLAVMGTGIDLIYPASNRNLAPKIVKNGALITELPPGSPALPYHFPSRNRIISGLAKAVVAIEAPIRSGVFSTVRWALEYGRDVYALPGDINRSVSEGTNKLIKNGAIPLTNYNDILDNTKLIVKKTENENTEKVPDLTEKEKKIFNTLDREPKSTDKLASEAGLKPHITMNVVALLELKGLIRDVGGRRFIKEE